MTVEQLRYMVIVLPAGSTVARLARLARRKVYTDKPWNSKKKRRRLAK